MTPDPIIEAAPAGPPLALRVVWRDGISGTVDFAPVAEPGTIVARLRDRAFFAQVRVGEAGCSIEWPGELDFGGDSLFVEAAAAGTLRLAPAKLRGWRQEVGASEAQVAKWLGVTATRYAELERSDRPLPQTIALAYRALRDRMPETGELWPARARQRQGSARVGTSAGATIGARP